MTDSPPPQLLQLALALGIVRLEPAEPAPRAVVDQAFFADPGRHLGALLADPVRRQAALDLAAALLGTAREVAPPGSAATWIPLTGVGGDAGALFLVVEASGEEVTLAIAGRATLRAGETRCSATVAVPMLAVGQGGGRLLLGTDAGGIELTVAVDLPETSAEPALGGLGLAVHLPTSGDAPPRLLVRLRELRLPGSPARDVVLGDGDLPGEAGELIKVIADLGLGLLQTRAGLDPATAGRLRPLLTMLGLGDTSMIPPLPLAEIPRAGPVVLADWVRAVFVPKPGDPVPPLPARAWLAALAELLDLPPQAPVPGDGTPGSPYLLRLSPLPGVTADLRLVVEAADDALLLRLGLGVWAEISAAVSVHADADLVSLRLGRDPGLDWLPGAKVSARLSGGNGPLLRRPDAPARASLAVDALSAGFRLDGDRRVALVLEAEGVVLAGNPYPRLDLSSVEALTDAAAKVSTDALADVLAELFAAAGGGDGERRAAALLALLALRAPDAGWPIPLPPITEVVSDPVGALSRYHAGALLDGTWGLLAAELATLIGAPAPAGAGTAADPWVLVPLGTAELPGALTLLVWRSGDDDLPALQFGVRLAQPSLAIVGGTVVLAGTLELARLTLPPSAIPSVRILTAASLGLSLGDDLSLDAGPMRLTVGELGISTGWRQGEGWSARARITRGSAEIDGTAVPFPDPWEFGTGQPLLPPDPDSPMWTVLTRLAGIALLRTVTGAGPAGFLDSRALAAGLLGWLSFDGRLRVDSADAGIDLSDLAAGWPALSLPMLANDPLGALRSWLAAVLDGENDLSLAAIALLRHVTAGDSGLDLQVAGAGTYVDPWSLPIGDTGAAALLWLDPDGPSLAGLSGVLDGLLPADLAEAVAGTAPLPGPDRLIEILHHVARFDVELRDLLDGRDGLAAALGELLDSAGGGDGILPASAQVMPGSMIAPVELTGTHLAAPGGFVLSDHLPAADPSRTLYALADLPGVSPWPGQPAATGARLLDLRTPGLAADSFDLGGLAASGPWYVLLPATEESTARLRRTVAELRQLTGRAVHLVAHSLAVRPAARIWAEGGAAQLVTLAGPLSSAPAAGPLEALGRSEIRDAFRLLQALVARVPETTVLRELCTVWATVLGDATSGSRPRPFPVAAFAPAPAVSPAQGTNPPLTVISALSADALRLELASLVAAVCGQIRRRLPGGSAAPARQPVSSLGLGLSLARTAGEAISCRSTTRLDLIRIELVAGAASLGPVLPRVQTHLSIGRPDGWLADPGPGSPSTARLRRVDLAVTAGSGGEAAEVSIVLHDAALDGVTRGRVRISGGALDAASRSFLGLLATALSPRPPGGPARDLVDLLVALGVAQVASDGGVVFLADPLERLLTDPGPALDAVLLTGDAGREPLRRLLRLSGTADSLVSFAAAGVTVRSDTPAALTVATGEAGLPIADVATLHARLTVSGERPPEVAALLRCGGVEAELLPTPDPPALARLILLVTAGEVARWGLQHLRDQGVTVDPLLDAVGLLAHPRSSPNRALPSSVRNPAALLTNPGRLLADQLGADAPGEPFRLAPGKLLALITSVAQLAGAPGGPGG
ncbi:hypothetical protein, partial [Nonomuraea sp. JJY05]|uniref:hypothetical protein n=1 Tax=Nonomuraea sp. JJY05 TaxID=3350255 RepID=UPI00373EDA63